MTVSSLSPLISGYRENARAAKSLQLTRIRRALCGRRQGKRPRHSHPQGGATFDHELDGDGGEQEAHHALQNGHSGVSEATTSGGKLWRDNPDYPCWSSTVNPTQQHLSEAEKHRKAAAQHRAASEALQNAEARACAGIPEHERDVSPFFHREDIADIQVERSQPTGKQLSSDAIGAVIVFRALPGLTAEWLQRAIDCHIARNAALGHDVPEMEYCPLVPRDVTAQVTSTGNGFAVRVTSKNPKSAAEIIERAEKLR